MMLLLVLSSCVASCEGGMVVRVQDADRGVFEFQLVCFDHYPPRLKLFFTDFTSMKTSWTSIENLNHRIRVRERELAQA